MKPGRFSLIPVVALFLCAILQGDAQAGFGFGGDDAGGSGLDLSYGYDVNTVATVSGTVWTLPDPDGGEDALIGISENGERFYVYVGPLSYWEKNGIPVRMNDRITARGSLAQGRNGRVYVLAQKLTNLTTRGRLAMRGEDGRPLWSASTSNGSRQGSSFFGWGGGRGMFGAGRGMMGMGRGGMGGGH